MTYLYYVQSLKDSLSAAKVLSATGEKSVSNSPSKVLLFSPHPDDECITGLLPLRLMNELGMHIINIPVTFGSNKNRQAERATELANTCKYLGWSNHLEHSDLRNLELIDIVKILTEYQPKAIFFPHEKDWNSRHISTNHLLWQALEAMPQDFSCLVIETEYWGAMDDPNLMIESDVESLATLVSATSFHVGEVTRNPYHLSLPFWMQDNVRRGSELVGGQGETAPPFTFATLYRIRRWHNQQLSQHLDQNRTVPSEGNHHKEIFQWKSSSLKTN